MCAEDGDSKPAAGKGDIMHDQDMGEPAFDTTHSPEARPGHATEGDEPGSEIPELPERADAGSPQDPAPPDEVGPSGGGQTV